MNKKIEKIEDTKLNEKINPFYLDMYWDEESELTFVKIVASCQEDKIDTERTFQTSTEAINWIETLMVEFGWEKTDE